MTEALPYVGDDPAQVRQLRGGLQTARGHILTFVSDLESARYSTNAAWQASEAMFADNQTAGLLRSGGSISRSLDSGIQAVSFYSTELIQRRRVVDILREEWNHIQSQATELESRTLLTPEELVSAREEVLRRGGNPEEVRLEAMVPGFTGKYGSYGNVDVYWDDGTTVWVWEVKGTAQPGMPIAGQGTSAVNEAQGYATALQTYFDETGIERQVRVGFPVDPTSAQYTNHDTWHWR